MLYLLLIWINAVYYSNVPTLVLNASNGDVGIK